MSFFSKWAYVKIELEIMGVVVDARYVQGKDYDKMFEFFKAVGKSQPYQWAIYVKRHFGKKTKYQRDRRRAIENEKRIQNRKR